MWCLFYSIYYHTFWGSNLKKKKKRSGLLDGLKMLTIFFFTFPIHGPLPLSCVSGGFPIVVESFPWSYLSTFGLQTGPWQHSLCISLASDPALCFRKVMFNVSTVLLLNKLLCKTYSSLCCFSVQTHEHWPCTLNASCAVLFCVFVYIYSFFFTLSLHLCVHCFYDYV